MKTIRISGLLVAFAFAGAAGCASALPPPELVSARGAYERASHGPAQALDPADLHVAKETLDAAERAFDADNDPQATKDIAYTAERRVETAEARARAMQATQQKEQTFAQIHATEVAAVQHTSAALNQANQQLASQNQQIANQGKELQDERQRRQEAERRAARAMTDLARIASVKQEARGMVITLSGSVLFVSGKSELLPAAQVKLNEVADALTKQEPDAPILVEGYTDTQGAAAFNQELSQRRAEAVRDYLVAHGVSGEKKEILKNK